MKILIAGEKFVDGDVLGNFQKIKDVVSHANADLVLFGEGALNGFDGINFNYEEDIFRVFSVNSVEITEVRNLAVEKNCAIGFGFYENDKGGIYSTYIIFSKTGEIITKYQRKSSGWRTQDSCKDYREGDELKIFDFMGKKFGLMVCGDFWEDGLLDEIIDMDYEVDYFIWPVHIDYNDEEWLEVLTEYKKRTEILEKSIIFVDNGHKNVDKNRLYLFRQGKILKEVSGNDKKLFIEL